MSKKNPQPDGRPYRIKTKDGRTIQYLGAVKVDMTLDDRLKDKLKEKPNE